MLMIIESKSDLLKELKEALIWCKVASDLQNSCQLVLGVGVHAPVDNNVCIWFLLVFDLLGFSYSCSLTASITAAIHFSCPANRGAVTTGSRLGRKIYHKISMFCPVSLQKGVIPCNVRHECAFVELKIVYIFGVGNMAENKYQMLIHRHYLIYWQNYRYWKIE